MTRTPYYNTKGKHKTRLPPGNVKTKACQLWENIKNRCEYLPKMDEVRFGKYEGTDACDSWKDFQNFAQWFEETQVQGFYHEGWQLDKDLLSKDNKLYSPEFCVFLPEEVNKALNTKSRTRGELPMGLSYNSRNKKLINVVYACKHEAFYLRMCVPKSRMLEGFELYKKSREGYIHFLAEKYKDKLDPRAYKALKEYEVSVDD